MAKIIRTSDGDFLDQLCLAEYGHLKGSLEAVLDANPGLAEVPEPYSLGMHIVLPDLPKPSNASVTLWE
ncbi:tail protein X [Chitinimonas sp. PSY-7]|uniref:tail protein X n=1 Tax=Chitinimonas sp. PSY-7 TaxID=3459088 RepID=UPI00403FF931